MIEFQTINPLLTIHGPLGGVHQLRKWCFGPRNAKHVVLQQERAQHSDADQIGNGKLIHFIHSFISICFI